MGSDHYGNIYYTLGEKRYVVYAFEAEPTAVPVAWHCWLHRLTQDIPVHASQDKKASPSVPLYPPGMNRTGTPIAYHKKSTKGVSWHVWHPQEGKEARK